MSYGIEGLILAVDSYDPTHGASLSTWASAKIRFSIMEHLRSNDWVSRSTRRRMREFKKAREQAEMKLSRKVTDEDVADELDITIDDYHSFLAKTTDTQLDSVNDCLSECSVSEILEASADLDPVVLLQREALFQVLAKEVDGLEGNEGDVIRQHHLEEQRLSQVGKAKGFTESRACQLASAGRKRLRMRLHLHGIDSVLATDVN